MSSRAITASGVERLAKCPSSHSLPWVKTTNDQAERGTAVHEFIANAFVSGRDAALKAVKPKYKAFCESIDLDSIRALVGNGKADAELAFDYDANSDTATLLGSGLNREYGETKPGHVYGTADLVVIYELSGRVLVADYKSGLDVPAPTENAQLRTLGVMASRAFGVNTVDVAIIYLREGRTPPVEMATLDALELEIAADELRHTVESVARLNGDARDVSPGEHCRYCNALPHCPAHVALVKALPVTLNGLEQDVMELTPDRAAAAWETVIKAEKILERIKGGLKEYAKQTPLLLPGGKRVAEVVQEREEIDPAVAYSVIANAYGLEVAQVAVEQAATKASIIRALKADAPKAIEAIRDAGGVLIKHVAMVKEISK